MKRFLLFFLLFTLSCNTIFDSPQSTDNLFEITDHLFEGSSITSIAFDSKGTAWIGTFRDGLIQYDGVTTTFYNSQNSEYLDNTIIWEVFVDSRDNIWIGHSRGLIKYDKRTFIQFTHENSALSPYHTSSIKEDRDGIIWASSCAFREGGLARYDGTAWTLYTPDNSPLPANLINDIEVDSKNNKWLSIDHHNCLVKIEGSVWTVYDEKAMGFSTWQTNKIVIDRDDNIYGKIDYAYSSCPPFDREQIVKYTASNDLWTLANLVNTEGRILGEISGLAIDNNDCFWAAGNLDENFIAIGRDGYWLDEKLSQISDVYGLKPRPLEIDHKNRAWIGTVDGVYIIEHHPEYDLLF